MLVFIGVFFSLIGIFVIIGSYFSWSWLLKMWQDVDFVKVFGRNGARVFYAIFGFITLVLGIVLASGIVHQ